MKSYWSGAVWDIHNKYYFQSMLSHAKVFSGRLAKFSQPLL